MIARIALALALALALAGCEKGSALDPPLMQLRGAEEYRQAWGYLREGDVREAVPWLRKAAEQGNPEAQYQLGLLYMRGDALAKDTGQAREWLTRAAEGGHPKAQYYLGHIYGAGDGVARDYTESFKWFWLAASLGEKNAKSYMRVVVQKLSAEEYREAERRVHALWREMPKDFMREDKAPMH